LKHNDITFEVSADAANELQRLLKEEAKENYYIRIGVVPGGCSGMSYTMSYESEMVEDDSQFDHQGVKFIISPDVISYLNGSQLDYKNELMGGGFYFSNPNASRSCGCGSSFSC
jgi:iron-sulfur cluster assembly protein